MTKIYTNNLLVEWTNCWDRKSNRWIQRILCLQLGMSKFLCNITEEIYRSNSSSELPVKMRLCFQYSALAFLSCHIVLNKWILIPYLLQDLPPRKSCYVLDSFLRITHSHSSINRFIIPDAAFYHPETKQIWSVKRRRLLL